MDVVETPRMKQLEDIAERFELELSPKELESFQGWIDDALDSYNNIRQFNEPRLPVEYPRTPGQPPEPEENEYNAWCWKARVKGEEGGKLAGKQIALKDNICLAGVPMMNGSPLLEGFVPDIDATIVTRMLEAGGEITGKAVNEDLCFSGGSHTSANGPVRNPRDPDRSSGGSSSGSAALVASGQVDMAIGGDQGGSIRTPSSWCGVVGLKPSYGLVPYTGIVPMELTIDHCGPIARNVGDAALLLEVLAGEDPNDPRQSGLEPRIYTDHLDVEPGDVTIGVVGEGFGWDDSEPDVDETVRESLDRFRDAGADVKEVSIPLHRHGFDIWTAIATEGTFELLVRGNGVGTNWDGYHPTALRDAFGNAKKARPNDLPASVKMVLLLGEYLQEHYNGRYYSIGQNLSRRLKRAYDQVLEKCDVLAMPTNPFKAPPLPLDSTREEDIEWATNMIYNVAPFNATGHPAISLPCGESEGLPVGLMFIGPYGRDERVLGVARAFERVREQNQS